MALGHSPYLTFINWAQLLQHKDKDAKIVQRIQQYIHFSLCKDIFKLFSKSKLFSLQWNTSWIFNMSHMICWQIKSLWYQIKSSGSVSKGFWDNLLDKISWLTLPYIICPHFALLRALKTAVPNALSVRLILVINFIKLYKKKSKKTPTKTITLTLRENCYTIA